MPRHTDDSDAYWTRFLWNRYAIGIFVVAAVVGLYFALRESKTDRSINSIGDFYRQADTIGK